jgi:hypothetical protein
MARNLLAESYGDYLATPAAAATPLDESSNDLAAGAARS